jgi:hypothetical protein
MFDTSAATLPYQLVCPVSSHVTDFLMCLPHQKWYVFQTYHLLWFVTLEHHHCRRNMKPRVLVDKESVISMEHIVPECSKLYGIVVQGW